jgi:Transposase C of IS166 homeodomain
MLRQVVQEMGAENDKLRLLIQRLVRHQFGRRSEQLTADQLQLGLEDLEQTVAENQAAQEQRRRSSVRSAQRRRSAIWATCQSICRATRCWSTSRVAIARAAAGRCM